MKAKKKEEVIMITQSSIFTGMTYEVAFLHYIKLSKSTEDIQSQVFLRFKNGIEAPATLFSKSNVVIGKNGKPYKIIDGEGVPIVVITSTFTVPLAFLKALAFVPCPDQTFTKDYRVAYKDGNSKNLELKNLLWYKQS